MWYHPRMNIYMAAVYTNDYMPGMKLYGNLTPLEQSITRQLPHILESYHYVNKPKYVNAMRNDNAKVFLDSGAFSAFSLGVEIDLPTYCNYVKANADIIRMEDNVVMASVLDGIGDPLQTYRNQLSMEELGVKPLPCFHFGEDERYLEWYIKNYEYITIGGMVGKPVKQLIKWLDRIWERYLVDHTGKAKIKVHAFGITSIRVMERYPWFSCDSSSWIQAAAFGSIIDPDHGPISISEKSPSRHEAGRHAATLTPLEEDYLFSKLENAGFTYERLSTAYESRVAFNLWSFGVVNATINAANNEKFKATVQELF